MPAYSFEAVDAQGATRKGVLDAETARAARSALRAQALVPLQVLQVGAASGDEAAAGGGQVQGWFSARVFNPAALAVWKPFSSPNTVVATTCWGSFSTSPQFFTTAVSVRPCSCIKCARRSRDPAE